VYKAGAEFAIGRAVTLREGRDVTLVACGIMVGEALTAAQTLAAEGIDCAVIDMFTVKPLDAEALLASAGKTRAVVTAENHNRVGGLYAAFGEVGPQDYLQKRFRLTAEHIAEKARRALARKS
jgi:transketolase